MTAQWTLIREAIRKISKIGVPCPQDQYARMRASFMLCPSDSCSEDSSAALSCFEIST